LRKIEKIEYNKWVGSHGPKLLKFCGQRYMYYYKKYLKRKFNSKKFFLLHRNGQLIHYYKNKTPSLNYFVNFEFKILTLMSWLQ